MAEGGADNFNNQDRHQQEEEEEEVRRSPPQDRKANDPLVLAALPVFRGNLDSHERGRVEEGPRIQEFLRALTNHFSTYHVEDDNVKTQILFGRLCSRYGDARTIFGCFAGRCIPYDKIERRMLRLYPEYRRTLFWEAARSYKSIQCAQPTPPKGAAALEAQTRAVVDSYLNEDGIRELGIHPDLKLSRQSGVTLARVMQYLLIQLALAQQLEERVYEKLRYVYPGDDATNLMAAMVQVLEREPKYKTKDSPSQRPEVLFQLENESTEGRVATRNDRNPVRRETGARPRLCFGCNSSKHLYKDCPTKKGQSCTYCKKNNHGVAKCKLRIQNGVPHCTRCNGTTHVKDNCRAKPCTKCGQFGHRADKCRVRQQVSMLREEANYAEDGHYRDQPDVDYVDIAGEEDSA